MSHAEALGTGPYLAAALLLTCAGLSKAWRPAPTAAALRAAGLPAGVAVVRVASGAEVVIGGWALTSSSLAALAVALSYLGFAGFVALALRRGSSAGSCACFGRAGAPPTAGHVAIDLAAAATAAWTAAHPHPGLLSSWAHQPLAGLPLAGLAGVIAYLAYLLMVELPRTASAARGGS